MQNVLISDKIMPILMPYSIPWSQRFSFAAKKQERRERKKRCEKTSSCGRCESHHHATIGVNNITRSTTGNQ